jgi:glycerophosphoryl diester phosphodiesterase
MHSRASTPSRRAALRALAAGAALVATAPVTHRLGAQHGPARTPARAPTLTGRRPLVIGHRGASGYRPEHTLEAYRLAIRQGADYIEPDLVLTKDGVPIARHEPLFGATAVNGVALPSANEYTTTDVAGRPEFAGRLRTRTLDGVSVTGYWSDDFTLAEAKTLRARERIPGTRPGSAAYDDRYEIPTLQEVIDLARAEGAAAGRAVGLYPEVKHPTFFAQNASNRTNPARLEDVVVATLHANFPDAATAPVFIQSFEVGALRHLRARTSIRLVQLLGAGGTRPYDFVASGDPRTYGDLLTAAGLDFVNDYAAGIGPARDLLIPRPGGVLGAATTLVADAHAAGLLVHAYTFRAENAFLSAAHRKGADPAAYGDYDGETLRFLRLGIDGFFTDQPDLGVRAVAGAATPGPRSLGR